VKKTFYKENIDKPKLRRKYRRRFGRLYYILKRWFRWLEMKKKFATVQNEKFLPAIIFSHSTILYRPLKDVDMWLQENKVRNLRVAINSLNGLIVQPGEIFSFWKTVGMPTKGKGYIKGMTLVNGTIQTSIGGGLCQLGNLLYWMFLHSPLTVIERWRHGFDVFPDVNRTQPFGSGATLAYNYIDLQAKNETDFSFQLKLWLTDSHLCGELRSSKEIDESYEIYEKKHLIKQQLWGGYSRHNLIFRKIFTKDGILIEDSYITENHAIMMYNPLLK